VKLPHCTPRSMYVNVRNQAYIGKVLWILNTATLYASHVIYSCKRHFLVQQVFNRSFKGSVMWGIYGVCTRISVVHWTWLL